MVEDMILVPNPSHPLNQCRQLWAKVMPWTCGGGKFHDLMQNYHGTLTSMGNSSNGWRAGGYTGSNGCIATDGIAGMVNFGTPPGLNNATQATLACWALKSVTGNTTGAGGSAGPFSGDNRFSFDWYTDNKLYFSAEDTAGGGNYGTTPVLSLGWHRVVGVFNGALTGSAARLKVYIDGIQQTLVFAGGGIPVALGSGVGPVTIGRDSVTHYDSGSYDDLSFWSRALSASEVLADYMLSRSGYPGVLIPSRTKWGPALPSTIIPASGIGSYTWLA